MLPKELAGVSLNRKRITCFINILIKLKCIFYFFAIFNRMIIIIPASVWGFKFFCCSN